MEEQEARQLAAQIEGEPEWHAEVRHNVWSDGWRVLAWTTDMAPADEEPGTMDELEEPFCYTCISSAQWDECESCEDGWVESPDWDDEAMQPCQWCDGKGGWWECLGNARHDLNPGSIHAVPLEQRVVSKGLFAAWRHNEWKRIGAMAWARRARPCSCSLRRASSPSLTAWSSRTPDARRRWAGTTSTPMPSR